MSYFRELRIGWIIETIRIFGFINRVHVERKFGVSTPQASKDLQDALRREPKMTYDKAAKRYVYPLE